VLAEFSKLRAACPELSAAQVLMQMGGADSAALLKPLLLAEAGENGGAVHRGGAFAFAHCC
jgi:hypothetical protein